MPLRRSDRMPRSDAVRCIVAIALSTSACGFGGTWATATERPASRSRIGMCILGVGGDDAMWRAVRGGCAHDVTWDEVVSGTVAAMSRVVATAPRALRVAVD